jgi:hypothetical protein
MVLLLQYRRRCKAHDWAVREDSLPLQASKQLPPATGCGWSKACQLAVDCCA